MPTDWRLLATTGVLLLALVLSSAVSAHGASSAVTPVVVFLAPGTGAHAGVRPTASDATISPLLGVRPGPVQLPRLPSLPLGAPPTSVPVGSLPQLSVYDPNDGLVYVANEGSGSVSIINGTQVVATIRVGTSPQYPSWDRADGYVYMPNILSNNVSVLNGTTLIGSVKVGSEPGFAVYDGADGYMDVTNFGSNNVSILNGTHLVGTVATGTEPGFPAYDGLDGDVYVPNEAQGTVTVINGTQVIGTVHVGSSPAYAAYDASDGYVYVSNSGSNNVSVLNGTQVVKSVKVGTQPENIIYDSPRSEIYVSNYGSDNVSEINGTKLAASIDAGSGPYGLDFDNWTGYVYVPNYNSNNVSVVNGSKVVGSVQVGLNPTSAVYDSEDGNEYVTNSGTNNVSVIDTRYAVIFTEQGLPATAGWWVNITGGPAAFSNQTSLTSAAPDGTYQYSVSPLDKTYSSPGGTFVMNGTAISETVNFTRVEYSAMLIESGLPLGTTWSVDLNGTAKSSRTTTLDFSEPNGTFSFTLGEVPGWTTTDFSGNLVVNGMPVAVTLQWTQVNYLVTFTESGLPTGMGWSVNVSGNLSASSTNSTITLNESNGTYAFSPSASHSTYTSPGGYLTVNGMAISQDVNFTLVTYVVNFNEMGLPTGTSWSVVLSGVAFSTSTSSISIPEPNGSYSYSLGGVPGWSTSSYSGSFVVNGVAVAENVLWTQVTYSAIFVERGLPGGTTWSISLNGDRQMSTSGMLVFEAGNGTYSFSVGAVTGFDASPVSGALAVAGGNTTRTVDFSAIASGTSSPVTFLGLPPAEGYALLGGILVVIVVGVALAALRLRMQDSRPPSTKK
jgi:YVTN family beta-propeller protein